MPLNKAPGADNIFTEMFVASGEAVLTELTSLKYMMYQEAVFQKRLTFPYSSLYQKSVEQQRVRNIAL